MAITCFDSPSTYYAEQRELSLPPVSVLLLAFHGMQTAELRPFSVLSPAPKAIKRGNSAESGGFGSRSLPCFSTLLRSLRLHGVHCVFEAGIWEFDSRSECVIRLLLINCLDSLSKAIHTFLWCVTWVSGNVASRFAVYSFFRYFTGV